MGRQLEVGTGPAAADNRRVSDSRSVGAFGLVTAVIGVGRTFPLRVFGPSAGEFRSDLFELHPASAGIVAEGLEVDWRSEIGCSSLQLHHPQRHPLWVEEVR